VGECPRPRLTAPDESSGGTAERAGLCNAFDSRSVLVDTAAVTEPHELALTHVTGLAMGEPAHPSWRVTLHFHPDRLFDGVPILQAMARDGIYRSQFETRTSNGGLTAFPGGDRWRWESRMFGGAYDDSAATRRPKYGSLNFRLREVGGSPRFGSAHLRLTERVLARATFCYPDSVFEPSCFGVVSRVSTLVRLAEADDKDALDDYIEAQVHGVLDLTADVEALVLDPCYRDTDVEVMARALGCPVEWHGGFVLDVDELRRHPEFRGPETVALGEALARDGRLDPSVIGDTSRTGEYEPQALKLLWHCLARFGNPEMTGANVTAPILGLSG
jgi:hypothetical protein